MINLNTVLDKVLNIDMLSEIITIFLAIIAIPAILVLSCKSSFKFVIQMLKDK